MWKMLKRNIKLCTFFSVFLDEWWGNCAADYVYALLPVWLLRKCDRAIWELKLWAGFFFKKKLISFFIFWDPKKVNLTWKIKKKLFGGHQCNQPRCFSQSQAKIKRSSPCRTSLERVDSPLVRTAGFVERWIEIREQIGVIVGGIRRKW